MEPASLRCPEEAWLEGVKRRGAGEAVVDSLQIDIYVDIICRYVDTGFIITLQTLM